MGRHGLQTASAHVAGIEVDFQVPLRQFRSEMGIVDRWQDLRTRHGRPHVFLHDTELLLSTDPRYARFNQATVDHCLEGFDVTQQVT